MNLILLLPQDFRDGGATARIGGRRFRHLREVIGAGAGDSLRVGLLEGPLGSGRVTAVEPTSLEMSVLFEEPPPTPLPLTLVLALPRPKVLRRLLTAVTSLGVKRLYLIHAYRVEKSYWQTPFLSRESIRRQLLLGLEQGRDTRLPSVRLRRRFKPFIEDELPGLVESTQALVAHPGSPSLASAAPRKEATLVIGPEGGFIPYEVKKLQAAGCQAFSLGQRVLRVETAVAAAVGRFL